MLQAYPEEGSIVTTHNMRQFTHGEVPLLYSQVTLRRAKVLMVAYIFTTLACPLLWLAVYRHHMNAG